MEDCMRECMRKHVIWFTRNFKPIMTHNELEPIMTTLGFVALPLSNIDCGGAASITAWKEYSYSAGSCRNRSRSEPHPRPSLPYPRIDGLHIYTYIAFLDAVGFYLETNDISHLFHVEEMPLHRVHDRNKKWRRILEDDSVFIYREGTLDQALYNIYHIDKNSGIYIINKNGGDDPTIIRKKGNSTSVGCLVRLKDIIV